MHELNCPFLLAPLKKQMKSEAHLKACIFGIHFLDDVAKRGQEPPYSPHGCATASHTKIEILLSLIEAKIVYSLVIIAKHFLCKSRVRIENDSKKSLLYFASLKSFKLRSQILLSISTVWGIAEISLSPIREKFFLILKFMEKQYFSTKFLNRQLKEKYCSFYAHGFFHFVLFSFWLFFSTLS